MVEQIKLNHRLALRLARYTVVLAFLIGLLLSSLQVMGDYQNQESSIDETIQQILVVSGPPATRAVNTLDTTLAEEVVNGLLQYPFVTSARIKDELDKDLAFSNIERGPSKTRWITDKITSENKTYEMELRTPDYVGVGPGHLILVVNMDKALGPFFERSVIVLLSGVARNVLLAFLLMVLFYIALTRPLEQLSTQFLSVKNNPNEFNRLSVAQNHTNNELGLLCDAGNQFIDTVQQLLKEQEKSAQDLRKSELRLLRLIDQLPQMVVAQNASGDILFSNQQFAHFYGQSIKTIRDFKLKGVTSAVLEMAHLDSIREKTLQSKAVTYINHLELTNVKGQKQTFSVQVAPFEYFNEPATLTVANDISKLIEAQAHIAHMANHDSLTGLPNRVLLSERITQALISSRSNAEYNALLFMDLDHFKSINDSMGHVVGDEVLKIIAKRLTQGLRPHDTVARLGGDEFIFLISALSKDKEKASNLVSKICDELLANLSKPVCVGERKLTVGASIGIVMFPIEVQSKDDLLRFADTAMYRAKSMGRNQAVFFNKSMGDEVERRLALESKLFKALEEKQFIMHYQSIHDSNGEVLGFEALLRWHHPDDGLVYPSEFMASLESGGLIFPVGHWVLELCCQQLALWRGSGFWQPHWLLSINISNSQFCRDDFVTKLHQIVSASGVNFSQICLEVTENVAMEDIDFAIGRLSQLRALGVKIALDNFGRGHGSMRILKALPLDILKIDRCLVENLPSSQQDRSMMQAIITVAESKGLQIIASGVESEAQMSSAQSCGSSLFQGYHLSRPVAQDHLPQIPNT